MQKYSVVALLVVVGIVFWGIYQFTALTPEPTPIENEKIPYADNTSMPLHYTDPEQQKHVVGTMDIYRNATVSLNKQESTAKIPQQKITIELEIQETKFTQSKAITMILDIAVAENRADFSVTIKNTTLQVLFKNQISLNQDANQNTARLFSDKSIDGIITQTDGSNQKILNQKQCQIILDHGFGLMTQLCINSFHLNNEDRLEMSYVIGDPKKVLDTCSASIHDLITTEPDKLVQNK